MTEPIKKEECKIRFVEDPEKGWKVEIDELGPACKEVFERASSNLGPHGKKFLAERIETNNPEVKKALKEIGLSKD